MRASRLLLVVLVALAASGCLRRSPQLQYPQYAYGPPVVAQASGYQVQAQTHPSPGDPAQAPIYQPQAYPSPGDAAQPQSYQQPGSPYLATAARAQASQTPAPRGLFGQRGSSYRAPVYRQPVYQQPLYQQPVSQPPVYPQPADAQPAYGHAAYPRPAAPVGMQTPCGAGRGCPASPTAAYSVSGYPAYAAYAPPGFLTGYQLDAGDRLRITVFGQQGLTNSYAVDAAGFVTLPLVGAVPARGLTTEQLAQSIAERLRQGYIREPQVAIEIEAYRPFFVHGEVTTPGQYPYVPNMTVENAIAVAGGFGPRADQRKITLSRTVGGATTQGAVGLNYPLRPGDTLRVGERWF